MRQISVSAVELQDFESGGEGAASGLSEGIYDFTNAVVIQSSRDGIRLAEGYGAGRDGFPTAGLNRNGRSVLLPWNIAACFSAGVGNLNAGHGAAFLDEGRYAREHCDVLVFPDSVIAGADAAARLDGGGFHHNESRAAYGTAAKVDQMPVRCESVDAGILAHWRDGDAIAKRDFADSKGSEEVRVQGLV